MVMQKEYIALDNEGQELIKLDALPKDLRKQVDGLYQSVLDAQQECGRSGLKLGSALKTARDTLKPYGLWNAFLGRVPGISESTARRLIEAFETAQDRLPGLVLTLASGAGMNIIGSSKNPFGRYTEAVDKIGPPPKTEDREQARNWLIEVEAERRRQRIAKRTDKPDKAGALKAQAIKAVLRAVRAEEGEENRTLTLQTIIGEIAKQLLAGKIETREGKQGTSVVIGPVLVNHKVKKAG